jgi:hypothetical protein
LTLRNRLRAILGAGWPLRNGPLASHAAPAVIAAIALPLLLSGAAQGEVERAANALFIPDIAVDPLMADGEYLAPAEPASDLLWTPMQLQPRADHRPVEAVEKPVAPGPTAPAARHLACRERPVGLQLECTQGTQAAGVQVAAEMKCSALEVAQVMSLTLDTAQGATNVASVTGR